ncbi:hypothetical protein ACQ86O_12145 [Serratia sp. L9]|uniref:hypothetical protein n=1 Tax=Serratia sp. L9 TaxID=3423946 RepID=UPI003D6799D3
MVNPAKSTKSIKKAGTASGTLFFNWLRKNYILSASILFFIVIASISAGVSYMPANQLNLVSNYKLCEIYSLSQDKKPPSFATRAEQMLKKTTIDCSQEKQDVFYIERRTENERFKVMFIAACIKSANKTYQYCNNFKITG